MDIKQCLKCGKEFDIDVYHRNQKYCSIKCRNASRNRIIKDRSLNKCAICNKEFVALLSAPHQKYCSERCKNINNKLRLKLYHRKLKADVINYYGGKCEICGESHMEFLSIDHSFNDGNKHRKEIKGPIYEWIKKNYYPKHLGLRVLCHNCNMSIGSYGYSPLEKGMEDNFYKV